MAIPLRAFIEPSAQETDAEPRGHCQAPTVYVHQVANVIDLYIEHLRARHIAGDYSDEAIRKALHELRRFCAEFGDLDLGSCRQYDLTKWFLINSQWRASSTKKRIASTILAAFAWAQEEELIARNPYHWPKCVKGLPDKARRPASPNEYVTLMRFGSRPLRQALFALRRLGIRTKEMRCLLWAEVDLGASPHIHLDKHKTVKQTGKPRKIGLDAATANFLRALKRNQRGTSEHVFLNCEGNPWSCDTFAKHLRRNAERAGLDEGIEERVSGYSFRHTYVCDGIEAGVTTRRIADQIGHSSTSVIDKFYGSQTRERVEHLGNVATEMSTKRKRAKKPTKSVEQRTDGLRQLELFEALEPG